jgi:hypothetical protein
MVCTVQLPRLPSLTPSHQARGSSSKLTANRAWARSARVRFARSFLFEVRPIANCQRHFRARVRLDEAVRRVPSLTGTI